MCNEAFPLRRPRAGPLATAVCASLAVAGTPAASSGQPPRELPVSRLELLSKTDGQPSALPVTRLSDRADLDGSRILSLTFPRPAPVRDVLLLLVRGTPISTVLEGSVRGTFTGQLRGLTIRQALEAVLFSANLDYDVRGTVVRVFPRRPRTRLFDVNLVAVRRELSARSGPLVTSTSGSDPLTEIEAGVRALLSQQGRSHLDRRAGLVSVTDFADRLDQVGIYLETAELRATRQVRVDARVLQIALREDVSGIDFGALAAGGKSGVRPSSPAEAAFTVTDVDQLIAALGAWGEVASTLAPRVVATNNEPAVIRVTTGSRAAADGGSASDVSLAVTPQISADGIVQLSIVSNYTSPSPPGDSLALGQADTLVRLRAGETAILSGLVHPPAGLSSAGRRTELIVLLTPTLVQPGVPSQAGDR